MSTKLQQLRNQKLDELGEIEEIIRTALREKYAETSELSALESVSVGLYEELDKFTKKAPAEPVTEFVLNQLNDIVRETKKMAVGDPHIQKLTEFVAAGDNPQQRDALVLLRQSRQGLERHAGTIKRRISVLNNDLRELALLENAVRVFLNDGSSIKKSDLEFSLRDAYPDWFYAGFTHEFNFERFDSTDLFAYFGVK
jgi:hypothetical protein